MIRSIDVRNFRCYRHLQIDNCSRLNVIVGDNGSGKTALLESIFWPLGASTEIGARLRAQRGLDGTFGGTLGRIEAALWGDFFHNSDMNKPISLTLQGDGVESRSLEIARRGSQNAIFSSTDQSIDAVEAPMQFTWRDSQGNFRSVAPVIAENKISFPGTGETVDNCYYFSANQIIGSGENASRFSDLSKQSQHHRFVEIFTKEYDWISDINVEVYGGSPILFVTLKGSGRKQPLPNISSGINRVTGFMLAVATSNKGVVIIDEIENGIHYAHLEATWRSLLLFAREYECQLFVSTHSKECLEALVRAAGSDVKDISLWQIERGDDESGVRQFSGADLSLAIEYQEEVR